MLRFAQSAAFAVLFFALLSLAAAVIIAILPNLSQTQRNITIKGAMHESSSSFSSQVFHFFVSSAMLFLLFLMHVGKSPVVKSSHSPSFFSSFKSLLTTAHNRCEEFFVCHFLHVFFDFGFKILVFDVFQVSTLYCLHDKLTIVS